MEANNSAISLRFIMLMCSLFLIPIPQFTYTTNARTYKGMLPNMT